MKAEKIRELGEFITELATTAGMWRDGVTVTVQFGYVTKSGQVRHDGVLITDAGALATRELVRWADAQEPKCFASIDHGGLLIT